MHIFYHSIVYDFSLEMSQRRKRVSDPPKVIQGFNIGDGAGELSAIWICSRGRFEVRALFLLQRLAEPFVELLHKPIGDIRVRRAHLRDSL